MTQPLDFVSIGARIKALRLERKENQDDVASAIGVERPVVTQYESGKKKPGRDKLLALAKHLGVHLDILLYGEMQPGSVRPESREEERMILLSRTVPDAVRAAVLTMLEHAAEDDGAQAKKPPTKM